MLPLCPEQGGDDIHPLTRPFLPLVGGSFSSATSKGRDNQRTLLEISPLPGGGNFEQSFRLVFAPTSRLVPEQETWDVFIRIWVGIRSSPVPMMREAGKWRQFSIVTIQ